MTPSHWLKCTVPGLFESVMWPIVPCMSMCGSTGTTSAGAIEPAVSTAHFQALS